MLSQKVWSSNYLYENKLYKFIEIVLKLMIKKTPFKEWMKNSVVWKIRKKIMQTITAQAAVTQALKPVSNPLATI